MLLDRTVERRKFDREVALIEKNDARLRALGVWRIRVERPVMDFMLLPRHPLRAGTPVVDNRSLLLPATPRLQLIDYPGLGARPFGVRLDLSGYDQRPPSITFHDAWTWQPAVYAALPVGQLIDDAKKPLIVVLDAHPTARRPFLCLRGVREYHEHPQHDGDDWALYRGATNTYVLLERLARVMLASVSPTLVVSQSPGQMHFQVQWHPRTS